MGTVSPIHLITLEERMITLYQKLWWRYWPGVKVKISWPTYQPADPNAHYRPWIEKNIGTQGWHWDWTMEDNDAADNLLTLKVCKSKINYAILATLQWSK